MSLQGETRENTKIRIREPKHYKVIMHNDDFTTMEFVVEILKDIFHKDETTAEQITEKKLGELQKMLTNKKVELSVDTAAKLLVKEKGITTEFGAREIDRVIQNEIKPLLVDEILFGKLKKGGKCRLTASEGRFELEKLSMERKQIHGRTTAATQTACAI